MACNKNGFAYAFNASSISAGPVWSFQVGLGTENGVASCLGATIWNGTGLFQPGNATTINGTAYNRLDAPVGPGNRRPSLGDRPRRHHSRQPLDGCFGGDRRVDVFAGALPTAHI